MSGLRFRFDANAHEYVLLDTGVVVPHITGMLQDAGLIDTRWFKEEHSQRGQAVHRLTADYDLGAIEDLAAVDSKVKGYLIGHVQVRNIIKPDWRHIEEPMVHEQLRYGGRPDRCGYVWGAATVKEVKSGGEDKSHAIQTALQAMLYEQECGIPAEAIKRYGEYLKANGKFKLVEFTNARDFVEARRLIKRFC